MGGSVDGRWNFFRARFDVTRENIIIYTMWLLAALEERCPLARRVVVAIVVSSWDFSRWEMDFPGRPLRRLLNEVPHSMNSPFGKKKAM